MTSGSGRIGATPDQLDALAGRVGAVASEVQGAEADFTDTNGWLQSPLVEDALADFDGAWSQHRGQLLTILTDAERVLRSAAAEFRQADADLAAAFDPPAS